MAFLKLVLTIAITMAITVTLTSLTMRSIGQVKENTFNSVVVTGEFPVQDNMVLPSKKHGRFLQQDYFDRNPKAADHCRFDNQICYLQGRNSTCCNNKCMDLSTDKHNCGACKKKCKYTESCCRGQCVNLAYDKRHCGRCNNRCNQGEYCVYGLCDYA